MEPNQSIYNFSVNTIDGEEIRLEKFRQKTLLIVNVASQCGFTSQYSDLEKLYLTHKDRGLVILGFPCDQFGHQEPGDNAEIKIFCSKQYNISFPLFAKILVNGPDAHPLYIFLKQCVVDESNTQDIPWNFTKFLVDTSGRVLERYGPQINPTEIEKTILDLIN